MGIFCYPECLNFENYPQGNRTWFLFAVYQVTPRESWQFFQEVHWLIQVTSLAKWALRCNSLSDCIQLQDHSYSIKLQPNIPPRYFHLQDGESSVFAQLFFLDCSCSMISPWRSCSSSSAKIYQKLKKCADLFSLVYRLSNFCRNIKKMITTLLTLFFLFWMIPFQFYQKLSKYAVIFHLVWRHSNIFQYVNMPLITLISDQFCPKRWKYADICW